MNSRQPDTPLTIRHETAADAAAIEAVTRAAFQDAPHASHTEQAIVRTLRGCGALAVSLVAEVQGGVVGHVAASRVAVSDGAQDWYGLGPVSVLPSHQRRGIGARLVQRALDDLRALGARGCVVLGDPVYYGRFGFRTEPGLALPGVPPEYFQALPFGRDVPSGVVTYHAAFDAPA
jgi:putative acetyltransferase